MDLSGSWEYISRIARSRLAHNKTPHHVSDYGDGIEYMGVAGEFAARRYLGIDEIVHEGFDGGVDIYLGNMRIDVKATLLTPKLKFRFLQYPVGKNVKADIILMTAVDPIRKHAVVIGYATKAEILCARINHDRPSACREIPVDDLHPPYELVVRQLSFVTRGMLA
jgi:hypothetical protein